MGKWSKGLQETTRQEVYTGAVMKSDKGDFGIFVRDTDKVVIKGIVSGQSFPVASDETIATFPSVEKMIEAGWVID